MEMIWVAVYVIGFQVTFVLFSRYGCDDMADDPALSLALILVSCLWPLTVPVALLAFVLTCLYRLARIGR